jgi:hypothetical protein
VLEFLAVLLIVFAVSLVVLFVLAGLGVWHLGRKNRVSPTSKTMAPLTWLASPSRAARLHRRLKVAVLTVRSIPRRPGDEQISVSRAAACVDLERHAVSLDEWLWWTKRAPARVRRQHYDAIEAQVYEVESLAVRLSHLTPAAAGPHHATTAADLLADIARQIDILEDAHREVVEAEAHNGTRVMREIEQAPVTDDPRRLQRASRAAAEADSAPTRRSS